MSGKKVKGVPSPTISKKPRTENFPSPESSLENFPAWHLDLIDLEGPWGWQNVTREVLFSEILPKIKNFERRFWTEILNKQNHEVPVTEICKEAQKRLKHINCDDIEKLVSLRLTGTQRIWGLRYNNVFKILWWDPEHKVYPSPKKHT